MAYVICARRSRQCSCSIVWPSASSAWHCSGAPQAYSLPAASQVSYVSTISQSHIARAREPVISRL